MGRIEDLHIFHEHGYCGIDVKVLSTYNSESILVNACTDLVRNCRKMSTSGAVLLTEVQDDETFGSTCQLACTNVTLRAKGDHGQIHQFQTEFGTSKRLQFCRRIQPLLRDMAKMFFEIEMEQYCESITWNGFENTARIWLKNCHCT